MVTIQFWGTIHEVRKEMEELLAASMATPASPPAWPDYPAPAPMPVPAEPPVWPDYPAPAPEEEVNKVKRHRRTKAEMEAARAAEAAENGAASGQAEAEAAEPLALAPATFADVENALREILETDGLGVSHGRKFLEEGFGVKRLSLIDEARWPEFVAKAKALVAGAAKP